MGPNQPMQDVSLGVSINKRSHIMRIALIGVVLFSFCTCSELALCADTPRIALILQRGDSRIEEPLWTRMAELGWVRGKTLAVERREFGDNVDQVPAVTNELLKADVRAFVVPTAGVAARVREVTDRVPIIVITAGDLVEAGLAESLARPGGNVTGVQVLQVELAAKRLALLKAAIPGLSRVGVVMQVPSASWDPGSKGIYSSALREFQSAARSLALQLDTKIVHSKEDLDPAFASLRQMQVGGTLIFTNAFTFANREAITALAIDYRMPILCDSDEWVGAGALMAYYTPLAEMLRTTAEIVDKVLRGTNPRNIPVQQPITFRLALNLTTARNLGITIPQIIVQQADELVK